MKSQLPGNLHIYFTKVMHVIEIESVYSREKLYFLSDFSALAFRVKKNLWKDKIIIKK